MEGHQHLSHFRRLARGREELPASPCHPAKCWLPSPNIQQAPTGCRGLVGQQPLAAGHWTPPPPASRRGQCLPGPAKAWAHGGAPSPALSSGPCLVPRPGAGGGGRFLGHGGREGEGGGRIPPAYPLLCSGSGFARGGGVKGKEGCPGQRRRGHALWGRGRGRGVLSVPSPGARAGRPRGQGKGPGRSPRPRLSQARAGAGSGPLPRPGRSAQPPPRPAGPHRAASAGCSYLLPGAAARGPGPGGGGDGGCGWAGSLRGAGRRQ